MESCFQKVTLRYSFSRVGSIFVSRFRFDLSCFALPLHCFVLAFILFLFPTDGALPLGERVLN